jgi:hypothetical protein
LTLETAEDTGTGFAQYLLGNQNIKRKDVRDMKFVSRYYREDQAEAKPSQSLSALVVIAVLIILAVVLLTFENIDEPAPLTNLTFSQPESSSPAVATGDIGMHSGFKVKSQMRTSVLEN